MVRFIGFAKFIKNQGRNIIRQARFAKAAKEAAKNKIPSDRRSAQRRARDAGGSIESRGKAGVGAGGIAERVGAASERLRRYGDDGLKQRAGRKRKSRTLVTITLKGDKPGKYGTIRVALTRKQLADFKADPEGFMEGHGELDKVSGSDEYQFQAYRVGGLTW